MMQDWTRMLKSFRQAKTYRNLPTDDDRPVGLGTGSGLIDTQSSSQQLEQEQEQEQQAGHANCRLGQPDKWLDKTDWPSDCKSRREGTRKEKGQVKGKGKGRIETDLGLTGPVTSWIGLDGLDKPLAVRGRSASEPSFLSASRAVKVRVAASSPAPSPSSSSNIRSSYTPPAVKEISSITGLQQQIKAAFGRWRKRGTPSSSHAGLEEEVGGGSNSSGSTEGHRIREDSFDHPLNVRLSAQSRTFSHPHRLTVFPPFPSGVSTSSPTSSSSATSPVPASTKSTGSKSSSHPFAFVRGLRKRRGEGSESPQQHQQQHHHHLHHLTDPSSDRVRSRTDGGLTNRTIAGQDYGSYPLGSKSRSDHSLHRILKEDNTWTVFATLRPPCEKGGSLSKGSTAWTFGLFSDSASHPHPQRRQVSNCSGLGKSKSKAASVAPSPELLHRSFTPPASCASAAPPVGLLLPGFLGRNERRTRSLERCFQQRVRNSSSHAPATLSNPSNPLKPPPIPSRVRSRSLEKNYQISTALPSNSSNSNNNSLNNQQRIAGLSVPVGANSNQTSSVTPLLPVRRNKVPPPEVLATWCTFNEAFGGGRPRHRIPTEPLTVNDERDSPGSPVFEELFLPPPHKFAASGVAPAVGSCSVVGGSGGSNDLVINNNNNNKRNSVTSCCCSCGGGVGGSGTGGHSAGVSCSSKSTPRSSPVPPCLPGLPGLPETVLYGSREAPVLERHCVEGGEFIIAWLSHSKSGSSSSNSSSPASRGPPPPPPPHPQPSSIGVGASGGEMQSSNSSAAAGTVASNGSSGSSSNRSFINKPARGWLHSDVVIVREGITYFVRYIGCLEVNTSMKSLDFDTRSQIAKECINIVCETAGLKTVDKKRKVDRRIQRILGDAPHMEHAGSDVALTISSGCLRISTLEGSTVVACHDMPNISFASGGDPDTLDFVAYVAKDNVHGRACYVLECGGGLAQDVITTIGQAFELRFKEYLKRTPRPANESLLDGRETVVSAVGSTGSGAGVGTGAGAGAPPPWSPDDPEYYNDLPGKVPPDVGPPPVPPLPNYQAPGAGPTGAGQVGPTGPAASSKKSLSAEHRARHAVDLSDNLIDLNADVSSMGRPDHSAAGSSGVGGLVSGTATLTAFPDHEYVNGIMGSSSDFKNAPVNKDPFDMHPFSAALPSPLPSALLAPNAGTVAGGVGRPVVTLQRGGTKAGKARVSPLEAQLSQEIWFHGPISRKEAEDLLKQDGDFLVRESQGSQGQYVLTGMQSGHHKHLLLVDPEGVVRTKDRTFESVSHLINFHRNNVLPIISAESVLLLKKPVARPHHS